LARSHHRGRGDVIWEMLDFLILDLPPGTGDVPLTVFQTIKLDGVIIVTSPQDLVHMVVKKAFNMAKAMEVPVLGIVENMSYMECPDCGRRVNVFGDGKIDAIAAGMGIPVLGRLPLDPRLAALADAGDVEKADVGALEKAVGLLEQL